MDASSETRERNETPPGRASLNPTSIVIATAAIASIALLHRHWLALTAFWLGVLTLAASWKVTRAAWRDNAAHQPPSRKILIAVMAIAATALALNAVRLIPPMQSPDELSHLYRAHSLVTNTLTLPRNSRHSLENQHVDAALADFANSWADHLSGKPDHKVTDALRAHTDAHVLENDGPQTHVFNTAAPYFPAVYWPAGTALSIAADQGAHVSTGYRAARVAMAVVGLLFLLMAAATIRHGMMAVAALSVMPMTAAQLASVNADALTIPMAAMVIAMISQGVYGGNRLNVPLWAKVGAWVALGVLVLAKPPFILLLLPIVVMWRDPKQRSALDIAATGALITALAVWATFLAGSFTDARVAAAGEGIWTNAHGDVGTIASAVANTVGERMNFYVKSAIGVLGWLDTELPRWFYILGKLFLLIALVLTAMTTTRVARVDRWTSLLTAMLAVIAIHVGLMLTWDYDPDKNLIIGLQGRYFLPFLPLVALFLGRLPISPSVADTRRRDAKLVNTFAVCTAIFGIVAFIAMTDTLSQRFG